MNLNKLFWQTSNALEAQVKKFVQPSGVKTGLLRHKEDGRDKNFEATMGWLGKQPTFKSVSNFNGEIMRQVHNICVFASRKMGRLYQQGLEFSMKLPVVWGKRNGWVTGDGFSSLRAENDNGTKNGLVLVEDCPDNQTPWREFSTLDNATYASLMEKAKLCKIPAYRPIYNVETALEALDKGFVLFTGYKWYNSDYRLKPPDFIYKFNGSIIGHHAINVTGTMPNGLYQQPNTFGKEWGDGGVGWLKTIFSKNQYPIYIEEFIPLDIRVPLFIRQNEGRVVRTANDPACYKLENGTKRHIKTLDDYHALGGKHRVVKQELLDAVPTGVPYSLT